MGGRTGREGAGHAPRSRVPSPRKCGCPPVRGEGWIVGGRSAGRVPGNGHILVLDSCLFLLGGRTRRGEASSAGGGVRWGPNGARGWFVGGCTHVIDPRHDVQDLSARLAALAACARSVTRKIPEVESAGIAATLFVPLGASSLDPKISSGLSLDSEEELRISVNPHTR